MTIASTRTFQADSAGTQRLVAAIGDTYTGSEAPLPPGVTAGPDDYDSTPTYVRLEADAPALAITTDGTHSIGVVPVTGTVVGVTYIPDITITGAATNNRAVSVINKGTAGAGTTSIATLTFASGVNATAADEKVITLSTTAANLVVTAGEVLGFASIHANTGIIDPGGRVIVEIDPA